jgi:hypothetical protein
VIRSMSRSSRSQVILRRLTSGNPMVGMASPPLWEWNAKTNEFMSEATLVARATQSRLVASNNGPLKFVSLPKSTNTLSHVKPDVRDRGVRPVCDRHTLASEVV